jgi:hypothetical protein
MVLNLKNGIDGGTTIGGTPVDLEVGAAGLGGLTLGLSGFIGLSDFGFIDTIDFDLLRDISNQAALERNPFTEDEIEDTLNLENPSEDIVYGNFSISSNFIKNNLLRTLGNSNNSNTDIDFPNVLTHEMIKVKDKVLFRTNDCSILPDSIFSIHKNYLEDIQEANANRFFLGNRNQKTFREIYYEGLKDTNDSIIKTYNDFKIILEKKDIIKSKLNFGNKLANFYLNESKSSSLGKIARILLDNDDIDFSKGENNNKKFNSNIENFILSRSTNDFDNSNYIDNMSNVFEIMCSTFNSESSYLKSANENKFIINSDKLIGQVFTNTSISLNGFYKDSISYEFYNKKINDSEEKESYSLIESKNFNSIPFVKINSLLSRETNSDGIFNPINYDNIYIKNQNIFDFKGFDEDNFDSIKNLSKDVFGEISTTNEETFRTFGYSLFLENVVSKYSYFTEEKNYNNDIYDDKFGDYTTNSTSFDTYKNLIFNPFTFSQMTTEDFSDKNFFEINLTDMTFSSHKSNLNELKNPESDISFNRAKSILSSTKFTYSFVRDKDLSEGDKIEKFTHLKFGNNSGSFIDPISIKSYSLDFVKRSSESFNNIVLKNSSELIDSKKMIEYTHSGEDNLSYSAEVLKLNSLHFIKNHFISKPLKVQPGFVLLRNSMNNIPLNKMSEKFIKFNSSLTSIDEYIPNRLVSMSYRRDDDNLYHIIDDDKQKSFNKDNWEKISFDLRRNINRLKRKKLENSNENSFIDYLDNFKDKVKNVSKIERTTPFLSLLYSNISKYSLDNYDDSEFINSFQGEFYKNFDYSKEYNGIKDSMEFKLSSNDDINFPISGSDIKNFLSSYYTDSEFKNSSTYFHYILKSIRNKLNKNIFRSADGFDKLLSDAIINEKNSEIFSVIAISSILRYKNIKVENDFNTINEKTNGSYLKYINKVFSVKNIQRQKSFTLRTIEFPDTKVTTVEPEDLTISVFTDPTDGDYYAKNDKDFGVMPGKIYTYCFPYLSTKYKIGKNLDCSQYSSLVEDAGIASSNAKIISSGNSDNEDFSGLYEYVYNEFYNHDVYLNLDKEEKTSYDFDRNKGIIYNIYRKANNNGLIGNNTLEDYISNISNLDGERVFDDIISSLNYNTYGTSIIEYLIGGGESVSQLSTLINKTVIEMFKFVNDNFESEISSISTLEDTYNYINNNKDIIEIFGSLLIPMCNIYSTYYDNIIELSVKRNIHDAINDTPNQSDHFVGSISLDNVKNSMWNDEVFNLYFKRFIDKMITKSKDMKFERDILPESSDEFDQILYTKLNADLQNILRTLNNSDICEIMSFDTLYSYVSEIENFQGTQNDLVFISDSLSKLEERFQIENSINLINNDLRLNYISKHMNDYYYFQDKEYRKNYFDLPRDLNFNLKNHFNYSINENNKSFFENVLLREKNKSLLANQGISTLNSLYTKYDIIRFGIDYKIASLLSNKKILKFKCNIINHKFPDIFIPPIYKIYTPVFTDIVPSYLDLAKRNTLASESGIFIDDIIGAYNFDSKDLKERYNLLNRDESVLFIKENIINNINTERLINNNQSLLSSNDNDLIDISLSIYRSMIISNAVKYTNYRTQKNIDENYINNIDIENNLINSSVQSFVNIMNKKEFEEVFLESFSNIENIFNDDIDRSFINSNRIYSLDFLNHISEYSSNDRLDLIFQDKSFYDIFSIVIGREDIKSIMEKYYGEPDSPLLPGRPYENDEFYDSFSYIIEVEVV